MRIDQVASSETGDTGGLLMNKHAIWAAVGLMMTIVGCVTFLVYKNKDTTDILAVVNIVIVPLLAALGYSKLRGIEEKTDTVKTNTNGQMSRVMETLLARLPQEQSQTTNTDDGDGTVDRRKV